VHRAQVFIHLLLRAVHAIGSDPTDDDEIVVATRVDTAGWVLVEIRDRGAPIAAEHQNRLIDPLAVTGGACLGLAIGQTIVRGLGGSMTFRSEAGETVFCVALPPADRARDLAPLPAVAAPRRGRVLVVDDDITFATSMRRLLSREHDVTVETSPGAVLELVERGARFDAILSDMMMPGMDGVELHDRIAAVAPDQAERMIFVTGGVFTDSARRFLEQASNPCFDKPCDLDELRATVRRLV
jgi:CheY-like chemotaxis protein